MERVIAGTGQQRGRHKRSLARLVRRHILIAFILMQVEIVLVLMSFLLHLLPLIVVGESLCLGAIVWTLRYQGQNSQFSRRLVLLLLLKTVAILIGVTGGLTSPCLGLLVLVVLASVMVLNMRDALWMMFLVSLVYVLLFVLSIGAGQTLTAAWGWAVIRSLLVAAVTLTVGLTTIFLRRRTLLSIKRTRRVNHRSARRARRAEQLAEHARALEWQSDTQTMLESLVTLEDVLTVALLRLQDIVDYDNAAALLRDVGAGAEARLRIAQTYQKQHDREAGTLADARPISFSIAEVPLALMQVGRDAVFAAAPEAPLPMGKEETEFAHHLRNTLDTEACAVLLIPLRTLEEFVGLLVATSRRSHPFTESEKTRAEGFASRAVYAIQRAQLQTAATTDGLTGLVNHRDFQRRLYQEVERGSRYHHPVSLVMIDIDHFKSVNDTAGHPAGDGVLVQLGSLLRGSVRGIDVAARYGGEEMAILCPETHLKEAVSLAERLRETIAATRFTLHSNGGTHDFDSDAHEPPHLKLTVSLGVSTFQPGGENSCSHKNGAANGETESNEAIANEAALLIARADEALYEAKRGGRNRVVVQPT